MPIKKYNNYNPVMTSKSQMDIETKVVSQPSSSDYDNYNLQDEGNHVGADFDSSVLDSLVELKAAEESVTTETETETKNVTDTTEVPKNVASGIRSGKVHVSQLSVQDLDNFMAESIIAKPLNLPNFLDLRAKDPNYRLRWVFRGNPNSKSGPVRYDQMLAAGFTNAKTEEVIGLNSNLLNKPDGIMYHDLILMKIETSKLFAQYKHNAIRSLQMTGRAGAHAMAKAEGNKSLKEEVGRAGYNYNSVADKIGVYVPSDKDFERLENKS